MEPLTWIGMGSKLFLKSQQRRFFGRKQYEGSPEDICNQIINDCWNGNYFQVSNNYFSQFWIRDFGWCVEELVKRGHREKAQESLEWALEQYERAGKITTTVTKRGKAFDFPYMAIDSLPWLVYALRVSGAEYDKDWLEEKVKQYAEQTFDFNSGLVRADKIFSSMRDVAKLKSSCYGNVMVASLSRNLEKLNIDNPFRKINFKQNIERAFWQGDYFYADLARTEQVTGDAQVFPFYVKIFESDERLQDVAESISAAGLDHPFPLKYQADQSGEYTWEERIFMKGYARDSIWMHLGPLYVRLLEQADPQKAARHREQYRQQVEKYKNVVEVFSADGSKPFQTWFMNADDSMLWAVNLLPLLEKEKPNSQ